MLTKWLGLCITALSIGAAAQTNTYPGSGNVGIGTTSPATLLNLYGTGQSPSLTTDTSILYIGNNISQALAIGADPNSPYDIWLQVKRTRNDGTSWPLDLNPLGGYVGVGTMSPGVPLDVSGTIRTSANSGTGDPGGVIFPDGSTQTTAFIPANCGADFAESVGVGSDRAKYEPGDLMVIDPDKPGSFLKSNQPYSTLVAGVYSTKPGFVGRKHPASDPASADEIPMAMVGRVPTKTSTENGPIKVGDLLVASSKPGYAMRGTDHDRMLGAVIGKALGSLDSGTGVIEVLVTLQ